MLSRRVRLLTGRLLLSRRLGRALPEPVRVIAQRLAEAGHEVVLAGGCVRDLLLGRAPKDWDLATSASIDQLTRLFAHGHRMGSGRDGATLLLPVEGRPYEITPYRAEDLTADLARRDFTVNAMVLGLDGRLHDPMGGQRDLAAGLLRACGRPGDRLAEDPLRMLRAVRLAAQFDLRLEPDLTAAICSQAPALGGVALERIGAELCRLLVTDRPAWGMERLRELGLLAQFAPELLEMVGVEQNQFHAFAVWEHSLLALALIQPQLHLRLAALLHDLGKPRSLSVDEQGNRHFYRHEQIGATMAEALLERLRLDGETRGKVVHLVRYHMDLHFDIPVKDAAIRRMLSRVGVAHIHDLIQLRRADRLASGMRQGDLSPETVDLLRQVEQVLAADAALKVTDLAVDGADLLRIFGRAPGPWVGQVLQQLLEEVLEDPSRNQRERLLARVGELAMPQGAITGHPEVDALLRDLLMRVESTLGDRFFGLYLYGSLATGDYDPQRSDIDFVVVTRGELPGSTIAELRRMHADLAAQGRAWTKLEGTYIPLQALRAYDPHDPPRPTVNEGSFCLEPHGSDWVLQRKLLRESQVAVAGPPLHDYIAPVSAAELRAAVRQILLRWWVPMLTDPTRLDGEGYQPFAVLSMCRALYTLEHGTLASKAASGHWAIGALGSRWDDLIRAALAWRRGDPPGSKAEAMEFIRYTVARCEQAQGEKGPQPESPERPADDGDRGEGSSR